MHLVSCCRELSVLKTSIVYDCLMYILASTFSSVVSLTLLFNFQTVYLLIDSDVCVVHLFTHPQLLSRPGINKYKYTTHVSVPSFPFTVQSL
jgi:hypothetical protein